MSDVLQKKRILLVEDDAGSRKLMSIVLGRTGYEVIGVPDGETALDPTNGAASVDLIIMDLELPSLSGAAVIEKLKSDPVTKHIPVIVTTSTDRGSQVVQQAIKAGAEKILYKPTPMNLANGTPITEVSALLGHANVNITMQVYAHFIPKLKTDSASRLAESIFKAPSEAASE